MASPHRFERKADKAPKRYVHLSPSTRLDAFMMYLAKLGISLNYTGENHSTLNLLSEPRSTQSHRCRFSTHNISPRPH